MKKFIAFLSISVFIFMQLSVCSGISSAESSSALEQSGLVTITDMAGREVTINRSIEKVVAGTWAIAEVMFSVIGEEAVDMLVGVGRTKDADTLKALYSERYPRLADIMDVGGGGGKGLDVEGIISLKPDVYILGTRDPDSFTDIFELLERVGIPTVVFISYTDPVQGPQSGVKLIGKLFGKEEEAQEEIDFINAQFDLIRDKNLSEKTDKPTVYFELSNPSEDTTEYARTYTSGEWATLVEMAGGDNIAMNVVDGNIPIDPEYLLTQNPNYIFISAATGFGASEEAIYSRYDGFVSRIGWDTLSAVTENRLYFLPHNLTSQMSFYGMLVMAKTLYPEECEDVDPDGILKEYIDKYMLLDFDQGVWTVHINN